VRGHAVRAQPASLRQSLPDRPQHVTSATRAAAFGKAIMTPQGSDTNEQRNMIIAVVLSLALLFLYDMFVGQPERTRMAKERAEVQATEQAPGAPAAEVALRPRTEVLAETQGGRVPIDTEALDGTLNLVGARFDDLNLRRYRQELESPEEVTLLSPRGSEHGFDVVFGWEEQDARFVGVGADLPWTAAPNQTLTPETPITISTVTGDGLEVTRTIAIDQNYMMTITDVVRNASDSARQVRPYATVRRQNLPEDFVPNQIVHQGFTGVFGPEQRLHEIVYQKAQRHAKDRERGKVGENERLEDLTGTGGWLGLGDHYWLTAVIPDQTEEINAWYDARQRDTYLDFRAAYTGTFRTIAPGATAEYTQRFYAGAKRVQLLQNYQETQGIPAFDKAVDWGNFWFLTRPFFALLEWFYGFVKNFGVAILLTTIVIKMVLFPLVYQSYKAMAKLRQVAPRMKEIQDKYAADKQRQMQEMQRLYQTEKVNPVAGCLPILLQIPVFYALYKVLTVTIEMRHAPFFGWIKDLSAPDSAYVTNLFGLIPYDPSSVPVLSFILAIGIWPILYGISMFALQGLSPPPTDQIQAQVFKFLPIVFTFLFAGFAAGMVIYWTWSNTLSILQQYVIMRRQGVETEFDKFIAKRFGSKAASPAK
jgi:YidC/Oxa1 family membrane protein insertase